MDRRPEFWVRKPGVLGVKRWVPDRVMQAWEAEGRRIVQHYTPACSLCAPRAGDMKNHLTEQVNKT